jgi:hypothetical protein
MDKDPTWNPEPLRTSNVESQSKPLPANVDAFNKPKTNSKPHQPHIEMLSPTFAGSLRANVPPHAALASAKQLSETYSGQGDGKADEQRTYLSPVSFRRPSSFDLNGLLAARQIYRIC